MKNISNNIKVFEFLEELVIEAYDDGNFEDAIKIARLLGSFSYWHYSSKLVSFKIESILNLIAEKFTVSNKKLNLKSNKQILHVFTETYYTGGHTRLAKNWILNRFIDETHHLFVSEQTREQIPLWFQKTILNNKGTIISAKHIDKDIDKALYLRSIANNFDYVVFHITPNDPIANLAFGYKNCKTKRIFLNQADHCFWYGMTACDVVAEIRTSGKDISILKRKSNKSLVLDIPLNPAINNISKNEARTKLGLNHDSKIILSIGTAWKYQPDGQVNFAETLINIVNSSENIKAILIGPSKDEQIWADAFIKSSGKVNAIGCIAENLYLYHAACDVYLVSYPIESLTACLEPALYNKPIVRLGYANMDTTDSIKKIAFNVNTEEEYVKKAIELLCNKDKKVKIKETILEMHTGDGWRSKLAKIYSFLEGDFEIKLNEDSLKKDVILGKFEKVSKSTSRIARKNSLKIILRKILNLSKKAPRKALNLLEINLLEMFLKSTSRIARKNSLKIAPKRRLSWANLKSILKMASRIARKDYLDYDLLQSLSKKYKGKINKLIDPLLD